jgi:hypothetical protein
MTDANPEKSDCGRPPDMNEVDPEEVRYRRARYLSELADWILTHPAPGARPGPLGPELFTPEAPAPVSDEGSRLSGSAAAVENEA